MPLPKIIVQIYEVQTPEEARQLAGVGVDHIGGVILSENDWRKPQLLRTVEVARTAGVKSSLIPLFMDRDAIQRLLDFYQPDIIHFCESLVANLQIAGYCRTLIENQAMIKQRYPQIALMRSIPIAPPGLTRWVPTLELAAMFEPVSDFFLTDTLLVDQSGHSGDRQPVEGFVGITGQTCDWELAARLVQTSGIPVILAGGLAPHNVFEGIVQVKPAGVDSCTGTNALDPLGRTIRFQKDLEKVRHFVDETRRAQDYLQQASAHANI